jgi:benzoylformate decarboxylase
MRTVRDAALDELRRLGGTTLFANPGSTEIPLLTDLPDDLHFVLALHEASVVGLATGHALGSGRPAVAILHTTAGLGNAVGALATARVNRAPLVVLVGQQDRRHLALEPFLAGRRLEELAGRYPVWTSQPTRPQDVPGALVRAWHEAEQHRGPALVVVPMDDWDAPAGTDPVAAPVRVLRSRAVEPESVAELASLLAAASAPVLVVGAGSDDPASWAALQALAERLGCPVWQEPFGARAGFPQHHPQFAGHLPPGRAGVRTALAGHDLVLAVGAPVFRQYPYEAGTFVEPGVRLAVVTEDPDEANRSPVDLAVVAHPAAVCARLAGELPQRARPGRPRGEVQRPASLRAGDRLTAAHVFVALADRLAPSTVLVEETPSSRPLLHQLVPAREPLGFLSAAMGGLGFGLPAAVGVRMARPDRPVVAVLGDGSSLYTIQALWSAAHYRVGVLVVVLANGRYAIMDSLAENRASSAADPSDTTSGVTALSPAPWPGFGDISIAGLAAAFGCPAQTVTTEAELVAALDGVLPTLADRSTPLVLEVVVP